VGWQWRRTDLPPFQEPWALGGDGPNVVDRGFEGRVVPELAFVAVRSWFVGDLIVPRQVSPSFLH